jgi:Tfp pilus assembly protein PilN
MRINLLPHREERRIALRQRFKTLSVFVGIVTAAILFFIYVYFMNLSDSQTTRNEVLRQSNAMMGNKASKIKSLKEQISYLIEQQDIIEKLKTDRYNGIILLKELAMALPDGVYLTKFTQKSFKPIEEKKTKAIKNKKNNASVSASLTTNPQPRATGFELKIEGATLSNVRVATFVNSLNASSYFEDAVLNEVKLEESPSFIRNSKFVLTVKSQFLVPSTEELTVVEKTSSAQKNSPFVKKGTDALKKMTESVAKTPGENQ